MTHQTTIELNGEKVPITVEYRVIPGCRGTRDSLGGIRGAGPALEPDEPDEIEIESVEGPSGIIELTEDQIEEVTKEILEWI